MSLTATLVMAAVVLVLIVAWLVMVFRAASQPVARGRGRSGDRGRGEES